MGWMGWDGNLCVQCTDSMSTIRAKKGGYPTATLETSFEEPLRNSTFIYDEDDARRDDLCKDCIDEAKTFWVDSLFGSLAMASPFSSCNQQNYQNKHILLFSPPKFSLLKIFSPRK